MTGPRRGRLVSRKKPKAKVVARGAKAVYQPTSLGRDVETFPHRRSVLPFRNRRGEEIEVASVTATEAKNEFGRVLETAIADGAVAITRHETAKAVLLSVDEYNALVASRHSDLTTLSNEFDALLSQMQMPRAREGMKAAFDASPAQLGRAALMAARKRG